MTVFVSDTFTDTDDVILENHTPEIGGDWIRRSGFNAVIIKSNAITGNGFTQSHLVNDVSAPSVKYNLEFDWNHIIEEGGNVGVLAYYLDSSNHYVFHKGKGFPGSQNIQLFKLFLGNTFVLDSVNETFVSGIVAGKMEITTASQKGFHGGVEKVSSTDADLTGPGDVGVLLSSTLNIRLDNFIATDTAAPVSANASMQPINVWWQLD